jgi:hypothetical protein
MDAVLAMSEAGRADNEHAEREEMERLRLELIEMGSQEGGSERTRAMGVQLHIIAANLLERLDGPLETSDGGESDGEGEADIPRSRLPQDGSDGHQRGGPEYAEHGEEATRSDLRSEPDFETNPDDEREDAEDDDYEDA